MGAQEVKPGVEERRKAYSRTVLYAAVAVTVCSFTISLASFNRYFDEGSAKDSSQSTSSVSGRPVMFATDVDFLSLKKEVESIQESLQGLDSGGNNEKISARVSMVQSGLMSLERRLGVLEAGISKSPEQLLSVPLLRKDFETLTKRVDENAAAVKAEIDRLWSLVFLILGVAGSVVTIAGGWFIKSFIPKVQAQP